MAKQFYCVMSPLKKLELYVHMTDNLFLFGIIQYFTLVLELNSYFTFTVEGGTDELPLKKFVNLINMVNVQRVWSMCG